jgi:hypothetical protein
VTFVSRWGPTLIIASWVWIGLVLALTFWRVWDIPKRLPEINAIATEHLFLVPVSLVLFLTLSWIRQQGDASGGRLHTFPRWSATIGIWVLAFLHPVSCGLYPAAFNLDSRTVDEVTRAVSRMHAGMSRADVEQKIVALNADLPVPMETSLAEHEAHARAVARYLSMNGGTNNAGERERLWPEISRATLVFVPWGPDGKPPSADARGQLFQRRIRASSDIGLDKIKVRYGADDKVEEIIYSSNRQLTEVRAPCTIHMIVPAPPEASFPYPCPR